MEARLQSAKYFAGMSILFPLPQSLCPFHVPLSPVYSLVLVLQCLIEAHKSEEL
jgi:hypothetical protein